MLPRLAGVVLLSTPSLERRQRSQIFIRLNCRRSSPRLQAEIKAQHRDWNQDESKSTFIKYIKIGGN